MGKTNKRPSAKSNRRGTPRVKNRDSNEATGITVDEVIEMVQAVLAPMPVVEMKPKRKKMTKETV